MGMFGQFSSSDTFVLLLSFETDISIYLLFLRSLEVVFKIGSSVSVEIRRGKKDVSSIVVE